MFFILQRFARFLELQYRVLACLGNNRAIGWIEVLGAILAGIKPKPPMEYPTMDAVQEYIDLRRLSARQLGLWQCEQDSSKRKVWLCSKHIQAERIAALFIKPKWHEGECPADLISYFIFRQNVLNLEPNAIRAMFDPSGDQCFCAECHAARGDAARYNRGNPPRPYLLPVGWTRFGLSVPEGMMVANRVMDDWHISYHAAPAASIKAILEAGGRMIRAGDYRADGVQLSVGSGHITRAFPRENAFTRQRELFDPTKQFFSSPSIKYCELPSYSKPVSFLGPNNRMFCMRFVFQLCQRPGSYGIGQETVGAAQQLDSKIENNQLEYYTEQVINVVITGICIEIHETGTKATNCIGLAKQIPQCSECAKKRTPAPAPAPIPTPTKK